MLLLSQVKTTSFALSIQWQHFNKSQTNEIMNKLRSKQRRVKMLEDVLLPYHSIKRSLPKSILPNRETRATCPSCN